MDLTSPPMLPWPSRTSVPGSSSRIRQRTVILITMTLPSSSPGMSRTSPSSSWPCFIKHVINSKLEKSDINYWNCSIWFLKIEYVIGLWRLMITCFLKEGLDVLVRCCTIDSVVLVGCVLNDLNHTSVSIIDVLLACWMLSRYDCLGVSKWSCWWCHKMVLMWNDQMWWWCLWQLSVSHPCC